MTLSTKNLKPLPDILELKRLTQSLAMLDAILSPEWEYRYYSFNQAWSDGGMMASMRNGSGDHWFAIFCAAGAAIHGLAHEAPIFRHGNPQPRSSRACLRRSMRTSCTNPHSPLTTARSVSGA